MYRLLLIYICATASVAQARSFLDSCYSHGDFQEEFNLQDYIMHVADFVEGSPRRLVSSMSAQDQAKYAATGTIRCGKKMIGTAQLTGKKDILTTAAHLFTNQKSCTEIPGRTACSFYVVSNGKMTEFPIERTLDTGWECPSLRLPMNPADDWSILKLKNPVPDVDPYVIDPARARAIKETDTITTIGHSTDFYARVNADGEWDLPKHYGTCPVKDVMRTFEPYFVRAPCGCASGCSGGTMLSGDPKPVFLGIVEALDESAADAAIPFDKKPKLKYDFKTSAASYVPLTGDFLKKLTYWTGDGK